VTLVPCPECGNETSNAAVACPQCGHAVSDAEVSQSAGSSQVGNAPPRRWLSYRLSGTVAAFWWASTISYGFSALMFASVWSDWSGYMNGDGTFAALFRSDPRAFDSAAWSSLITWIAGILFIVWLYKAYRSAESRGAAGRRWGPGWAVGGWFIPLANLVIPKMVVNETDRMSNPDCGSPPIEDRWKQLPRMRKSDAWWLLLLLGTATYWTGWGLYYSIPNFDAAATGTGYALMGIGQAVLTAAAALAGSIAITIGRRLRRPHPNAPMPS